MPFATQLQTAAIEVIADGHGAIILTDQSDAGRAAMLGILDGLAGPRRPVLSDLEKARRARADGLILYGEATMLACEAKDRANPFARTPMTAAERQAVAEAQADRVAA